MFEISVIVPVYNRSELLRRALESVAAQTLPPDEVIVVDDASSEDIREVVAGIGLDAARVLRLPHRSGPSGARNAGICAAKGKYVAFLDSDDQWTVDKLALQMEHLLRSGNFALSCTAYHFHNGDGSGTVRAFRTGEFRTPDLAFGCGLSPGSTLVARRQIFDEVGLFDTRLARLEDWDWLIGAGKKYSIGIVNEPLSHIYRSAPPDGRRVVCSCRRIRSRHKQTFRNFGVRYSLRFSAAIHHEIAVARFNDRRYLASLRSFMISITIYPFRESSFYSRIFSRVMRELFR